MRAGSKTSPARGGEAYGPSGSNGGGPSARTRDLLDAACDDTKQAISLAEFRVGCRWGIIVVQKQGKCPLLELTRTPLVGILSPVCLPIPLPRHLRNPQAGAQAIPVCRVGDRGRLESTQPRGSRGCRATGDHLPLPGSFSVRAPERPLLCPDVADAGALSAGNPWLGRRAVARMTSPGGCLEKGWR